MRNFRELNIWKNGIDITRAVYALFPVLPDYEKFSLQTQLSKSAISIPSNIAEGCGKSSDKDFKRFLDIALGSSYELETQLILASMLHNVEAAEAIKLVQNEQKMIVTMIAKT